MIERFGLPVRELWLVVVVVAVLTGSIIGFAATMPGGDAISTTDRDAISGDQPGGINPADSLFSSPL